MAARENGFAPEFNEKEVIELLENATPGSMKKPTNYGMKVFRGKNVTRLVGYLSSHIQRALVEKLLNISIHSLPLNFLPFLLV